jgi:zinc/manganese transport system permease protein
MSEAFHFLAAPLAMCLILAGIHCYLGLHVLARGVIFVDLSLAQVAAFGATCALLLGFEGHSLGAYLVSLTTTFLAAGLFALARRHEKDFSQEAIIGIVYALSSAAIVLVVDRLPHGAEHMKELMVGQVLWVTWSDVGKTAAIYSLVSLVHYVFRRQLLNVSFGRRQSRAGLWDFIFYALFGVVITSSVGVAGVLQVFAYLIVPSILGTVFFKSVRGRLLFGWATSLVLSCVGMWASWALDVPAGAFIVVLFTIFPIAVLILRSFKDSIANNP